jgi:hypothetical protein
VALPATIIIHRTVVEDGYNDRCLLSTHKHQTHKTEVRIMVLYTSIGKKQYIDWDLRRATSQDCHTLLKDFISSDPELEDVVLFLTKTLWDNHDPSFRPNRTRHFASASLVGTDLNERHRAPKKDRPTWYRADDITVSKEYLCETCRRINFRAILSETPTIIFILLRPARILV